jgi:hypothetical protein
MKKKIGIGLERFEILESYKQTDMDIKNIFSKPNEELIYLLPHIKKSKSKMKHDLFVLSELKMQTNGFFVEFGATNGIDLSNTYLLEFHFNWTGILAESAKCWHESLKKYKLLKSKGYSLQYSGLSRWDNRYVKDSINIIQ